MRCAENGKGAYGVRAWGLVRRKGRCGCGLGLGWDEWGKVDLGACRWVWHRVVTVVSCVPYPVPELNLDLDRD